MHQSQHAMLAVVKNVFLLCIVLTLHTCKESVLAQLAHPGLWCFNKDFPMCILLSIRTFVFGFKVRITSIFPMSIISRFPKRIIICSTSTSNFPSYSYDK